ncbi:hypothetical protein Axi01nite_23710 [Actinoplanes xinjiangensis]|nr:hypothetical protein Axi01nite_23710 [Actinoplanes xinjiangensis]
MRPAAPARQLARIAIGTANISIPQPTAGGMCRNNPTPNQAHATAATPIDATSVRVGLHRGTTVSVLSTES